MVASSDTGARSDDDITGDNTPALQVFGVPADAAQVELLLNGQPIPAVYDAATGTVTPLNGLPDGAHRLSYRFVDATGNTSAASPELAVVIDTQAPTQALTAPDLLDASDTGRSDSDNLTSDRTPSMGVVRGDASLTPKLLVNGVEVASQFDAATGSLTPLTALPDGAYEMQYVLEDAAGNRGDVSPSLEVVIDGTGPGAPQQPDMWSGSDTGTSDTDNVTQERRPGFVVGQLPQGVDGVVVRINGQVVAQYCHFHQSSLLKFIPVPRRICRKLVRTGVPECADGCGRCGRAICFDF
jgi:hypothetical protein